MTVAPATSLAKMVDPVALQGRVHSLARDDFATFAALVAPEAIGQPLARNWHIDAIAYELMQIARGEERRLLICMPPRCLKTFLATICFPAWLLGRNPKAKIICASYGSTLAEEFSVATLRLMQSVTYRSIFPNTHIDPSKRSATEFKTTAGGFRLATSVGGTLTGRGADIIIIDDPLKAGDAHSDLARQGSVDWFNTSVQSRLNNPKTGAFIVVAQRLHEEDLPGHLLRSGGWGQLTLPMTAPGDQRINLLAGHAPYLRRAGDLLQPERHGSAELERLRREMGERDYEAQYNQQPLPPGGATFKRAWVQRYACPPDVSHVQAIIQSWDTAYGTAENNDYSVCTTWAICGDKLCLLDVYRERLEFWKLEQQVYAKKK